MSTTLIHKIEDSRRLCIEKDIKELKSWMNTLECFNEELNHFNVLEKQLIKNTDISNKIRVTRRNNILLMASYCKYEQELIKEHEYGKNEYNSNRSKYHEQKRNEYLKLIKEYHLFKMQIYTFLLRFKR